MKQLFTKHPQSVGETYVGHMLSASCFGIQMVSSGIACLIHSLFPFMFQYTASRTICKLYDEFNNSKRTRIIEKHKNKLGS